MDMFVFLLSFIPIHIHGDTNRNLEQNCLNVDEINYSSPDVNVNKDNQSNCPSNVCDPQHRSVGCLLCDGDVCLTCSLGYVFFKGECVKCDEGETCPFNNTVEADCDGDDISLCGEGDYSCEKHACVSESCKAGIIGGDVECRLGGTGCKGCKCKKGWYPNKSDDCVSVCGDGNWTEDEECDTGDGCVGCKCGNGWVSVGGGVCAPICGDGVIEGNEECEIGGDGCGGVCTCLPGWHPNGGGNNSCHSECGDGVATMDEECDGSWGCENTTCNCSSGWEASGDGYCNEVCGDGEVVGREECDNTPGCDKE